MSAGEFEQRPWGEFTVLSDDHRSKVKRITIRPGGRLSYQSHTRRSEHWVVVTGVAEVTLDDVVHRVGPGESIDVPVGTRHRCANPGEAELVFVEVQLGDYFGEDDIVRYDDDYGRVG